MFFRHKVKNPVEQQIEMLINDLKLYLENNYKDLAIQSRKDAIMLVEESYRGGKISEKSYAKYKEILSEYTENMKGYNHQQFYHS
ncbi:hypothetical protein [Cellulosilyticum ruminicola]|uniref:hypothetical protein n=1 Tax=Cellulosilyticum ruminicola TaxID=425254 RepID=UPI000AD1ED1B|nr:hypothetical protein [Cellulosilyticum ruminicola]